MPPLPPTPSGVIRVSFRHTRGADTDVLCRVFWAYSGTAPTDAQLNTAAASIAAAWASDLASTALSEVVLTEVECLDLSSLSGAVGLWTGTHAGTHSGTLLPAGVAVQASFGIARRYRGGKPKVFLPYLAAGDLSTSQQWGGTTFSALQSGWTSFMSAIGTAVGVFATSGGQANVSYYSGNLVVTNPVTKRARNVPVVRTTPVVDAVVATSWPLRPASQRRRN